MDSYQLCYQPYRGCNVFDCWFWHAFSWSFRPVHPKRGVSTELESFWFNRKRLMLLMFSKRVFLWFESFEQWRKKWIVVSICRPQLQNGSREFWKLCLNLCSRKWLSPTHHLVSSLIPWGLCTLNILLGLGLINLRICFLKALTDSEFWLLLSLFHSITVDGQKEFQKYSCLALNKGMLL